MSRLRRAGPLLLLLGLCAARPLRAQAPSIGVEFGYTRATLRGAGGAGISPRQGAVAGAYLQLALTRWLALRPGIQLASKGGATTILPNDSTTPLRLELELVYLDMPVLFRARIPATGRAHLVLTAGVAPGANIGCNVQVSTGADALSRTACSRASGATFRGWDVALLGGAGFGIPLEGSELGLEVRYGHGLRAVSDLADVRNQAWSVLISIPF